MSAGAAAASSVVAWVAYDVINSTKSNEVNTRFRDGVDRAESYIAFVTVTSYTAESRELHVNLYSAALNETIPNTLILTDEFRVERSDAIVENNVLTGATAPQSASIADLQPGTHGFALVQRRQDGRAITSYILIGNPAPHP